MIMYDIIRLVIETGNYSLVELLKKIDTVWIQGDLTDDQRMGLITLARENADYTSEIDLIEKVHDLEKRVKALEENDSTGDSEQYPEYTPGKWYYNGDKITFKQKLYKCFAPDGQVCTWNPEEYPVYWSMITKEEGK